MPHIYRIFAITRYLIIIPVIGLTLAAALLFVIGGFKLLGELYSALFYSSTMPENVAVIDILEFVHLFLIGTVLWITAIGFYQLFIHKMPLPKWLEITDIEELETDLIGTVVVVLAVDFLSVIFHGGKDILEYGVSISLPIAALALYIGVRGRRTVIHEKIVASESAKTPEDREENKDN